MLLASKAGRWDRAICKPGTFNNGAHEVSVSGLRLSDGAVSGVLTVTLHPDSWSPKDRKPILCELGVTAAAKGRSVSGDYKGKIRGKEVSGPVSGSLGPPETIVKSAMIRLRMEKAVDGWAAHMARALLDIGWVGDAAREARIRCAYGWGWIGRIEAMNLRMTENSLEGEVRALVGMQPGSTDLGAEQYVFSVKGTVVGNGVAGRFGAKREGRKPLYHRRMSTVNE